MFRRNQFETDLLGGYIGKLSGFPFLIDNHPMVPNAMPTPTIDLVAGARPNFMKVAPLYHELKDANWCHPRIVHTGQHYDADMSDAFFRDLGLPEPDFHLGVGSGSQATQTAGVMVAYEKLCLENRPAWVIVVGDVNSTMACAIVAAKIHIPVAHLEAGLRSRDRTMPEEINRLVTDTISDVLWTPSEDADANLRAEGVPPERIERVGNIMIDAYELLRVRIEKEQTPRRYGLKPQRYGVVTLHRPSNVDCESDLVEILAGLRRVSEKLTLVFPLHPRTRASLKRFGLLEELDNEPNLKIIPPVSYVPFMTLVREARLVITDSGGIQEETTYLGIPCLTLRTTTERPITIEQGTNRLVRRERLQACVEEVLLGEWPVGTRPELWDGKTAERVAISLRSRLGVLSP
jgi:UDP-N-acetylglucosamine 2-epimerase (non-hydrolysing)